MACASFGRAVAGPGGRAESLEAEEMLVALRARGERSSLWPHSLALLVHAIPRSQKRTWGTRGDVLNTLEAEEMLAALRARG